ncbi:hypothetical protein [Vibrio cholerae]|uniref:hypothetical protein n=1 Tax=Vibrio cholerae TaxID=666 RepID=UPI001158F723|nr:hypothetical protein [Vibrio cholerae]TQQ69506.1 hypothetical protein FLL82_15750 [Vibrio cholerae]
MKIKFLLLVLFLLFVLFFISYNDREKNTNIDLSQLVLPPCNIEENILTTSVYFFIDKELINIISEQFLYAQIEQSNFVLSNSCLNLRRRMVSYEYINLGLSGGEDFNEIYRKSIDSIGEIGLKIKENPLSFYVFIIPSEHRIFENWVEGITYWKKDSSFILLNETAQPYILEHEFGHLMWANHLETRFFSLLQGQLERDLEIKDRFLVKRYARAYTCSNAGTIMSYEKIKLPIYSSPDIHYRGESCGDLEKANNKRQVSEYIENFIRNNHKASQ